MAKQVFDADDCYYDYDVYTAFKELNIEEDELESVYVPDPDFQQEMREKVPIFCLCKMPFTEEMIACAGGTSCSGKWFHYHCVGISPNHIPQVPWYCPQCKPPSRTKSDLPEINGA